MNELEVPSSDDPRANPGQMRTRNSICLLLLIAGSNPWQPFPHTSICSYVLRDVDANQLISALIIKSLRKANMLGMFSTGILRRDLLGKSGIHD